MCLRERKLSISARQNEVARHQKTLADLQKKLADESKKEASKTDEINRIERSITKSTSSSFIPFKTAADHKSNVCDSKYSEKEI